VCLIIAFVAVVYAVSAFSAGEALLGLSASAIALFFAGLMVRNIIQVKKMRETKGEES
jgi:di/tricarboxylate transporter